MQYRVQFAAWVAAVGLVVAGCGKGSEEQQPSGSEAGMSAVAASAPQPAPSGPTVTLSGAIRFTGPPPVRKPIKMSADPNCAKLHAEPVLSEDTIVGPEGGLQNVFVYVKSGLEGRSYPTPTTPAVLDQRGCMYHPRVIGVMVNQDIRLLNSDPTLHNVHALPKKGEFNVGMPRQNMEIVKKLANPEIMVRFKCDVHPWMSAWVGVLEHPFFAVSDAKGAYSIPNLPAGTYTIEAWHEKLGTRTQTVTVGETPAVALDFTFQPKAASGS